MNIEAIVVGPLLTNCYIIYEGKECIIVDPGGDPDAIIKFIEDKQLSPKLILATHGHFDHVLAVKEIKGRFDVPFYINSKDRDILDNFTETVMDFLGVDYFTPPKPDGFFAEDDTFQIGSAEIKIIETPGHTKGSSSFIVGDSILTGDFIFAGSIGRMDLGGSREDMIQSLSKFIEIKENYTLYPGHGGKTSLGYEKKENPFMKNLDLI